MGLSVSTGCEALHIIFPAAPGPTQAVLSFLLRFLCYQAQFDAVPSRSEHAALYGPLEGVEKLEDYRPGGYHPVEIGNVFHGRYRIVHKLGHGSYSTAWLARDEKSWRYVAVKVCTADSNPKEMDILASLTGNQPSKVPSKKMIPSIVDSFNIQGPNGNHACLVFCQLNDGLNGRGGERN